MVRVGCVVVGCLLAGQAWASSTCQVKDFGTLSVEMIGGQAVTAVKINGQDARLLVDTGAFFSSMSKANAQSLGLKLRAAPFGFRIGGIGGSTSAQIGIAQQFTILNTTLKDIEFIVGGTDIGYGLLGANLLDIADLELDLADGKVTLFKPEHCDKWAMAYWTKTGYQVANTEDSYNQNDRRTFVDVMVNGKKVRALIDSGAHATMLSRDAAERAGLDLNAPGVKVSGTYGIGSKVVKTWIVHVDAFSVGTETIHNSEMEVLDGSFTNIGTDMLLGADFLLAHRVFIANSQHKMYFTYNGGRVFAGAQAPSDTGKADAATGADGDDTKPRTASDYDLAGEAHLSRGEPKEAIADLNEAIRMAPDQPAYYVARSRALGADRQFDAALADLNKALSLDPKNVDALLARAQWRVRHKDPAGAAIDLTTASSLVPPDSRQSLIIADVYIELGQPDAAIPLLDAWIHTHGNDAMLGIALNARCWARGQLNQQLDDALSDCRKAIKRDGEKPAYLDSLGLVQLRLGHYDDAIKAYQQGLAVNPHLAWSRYGLGLAEVRNGQADAGHADMAAARAINPRIQIMAAKFGLTESGH
ncbi:aspartyl protease family protein [Dyella mobilis]|uniref:Aspartyl protease family protein n=2 Tax=Dyella mobilis TaxID=1849582 RepID=A0ABS2KGX0_9GAMM|nr:aspartyl protease family protein [Dyella mobilis]MBM7129623.1 aspartyl protease family protein [Dyella mobilis]